MVLDIAPRHDRRLVAEETQAGLIRLSNRSTRNEPVNRFQLGLQSRGDVEMILYLVSKGADVKAVNREGQTTVDMANGPVQRTQPFPETIKLLEGMGAKNNHKCVSC